MGFFNLIDILFHYKFIFFFITKITNSFATIPIYFIKKCLSFAKLFCIDDKIIVSGVNFFSIIDKIILIVNKLFFKHDKKRSNTTNLHHVCQKNFKCYEKILSCEKIQFNDDIYFFNINKFELIYDIKMHLRRERLEKVQE